MKAKRPTSTKPLHHADSLAAQIDAYRSYLDDADPRVRVIALEAIFDNLKSQLAQERDTAALPPPSTASQLARAQALIRSLS